MCLNKFCKSCQIQFKISLLQFLLKLTPNLQNCMQMLLKKLRQSNARNASKFCREARFMFVLTENLEEQAHAKLVCLHMQKIRKE